MDRPGLDVFLRSVYLQGLLIMRPEAVPPHLAEVLPVRQRLAAIAASAGMTEAELALRYALTLEIATRVLIGVETPEQIRDNVRMAERGPLAPEVMAKIAGAVADVNDRLLAPSGWSEMERAWKVAHS